MEDRLALFRSVEKELIESEDTEIRFHSGVPVVEAVQLKRELA